jgi:large subunit ribosomal protein L21
MYAIVRVGNKQYRVEKGDTLLVDRVPDDEGSKLDLEPLLFRSDETVFDSAELEKVKIEAAVVGHERGKKIHGLKFKPKRLQAPLRRPCRPHQDRDQGHQAAQSQARVLGQAEGRGEGGGPVRQEEGAGEEEGSREEEGAGC